MHKSAPSCANLNQVAPIRTKLHQTPPGCTNLHQVARNCTMLHQSVPSCTKVHQIPPSCTKLHHVASVCTKLEEPSPSWTNLHPKCTMLHQSAPSCTNLHQSAPNCTKLQQTASRCTKLHHVVIKGVSRQHTTFTSCQNAVCWNNFFPFLWRVDYALEENVLTEQMWFLLLIWNWEVITCTLIFRNHCFWSAWFALGCKSIFSLISFEM